MRTALLTVLAACAIVCTVRPARASDPAGAKHSPTATHATEKPKAPRSSMASTAGHPHTPAEKPKDSHAPVSAPKSAKAVRVDEVMGRVNKLIAEHEKECLPQEASPVVARHKAKAASRAAASPGRHTRVRLVWQVRLLWPSDVVD